MEKDHLEILLEHMNGKFDLALEAVAAVGVKIERLEKKVEGGDAHSQFLIGALSQRVEAVREELSGRIDGLEKKVDAVAADVAAHRRDTEAHFGVSRVCER